MRRSLLAVAVTLTLAACGGGGGDPVSPRSISGTYALRTINGRGLPYTSQVTADYRLEVSGSVLTLGNGGSCFERSTYIETINGFASEETAFDTCAFSVSGRTVRVTYTNGAQNSGTFDDNILSLRTDGGDDLVYRR